MEEWYICENGTGFCEHVGHLEKQEAEVKHMAKDVKEEEIEIARDQLDMNHLPVAVSALVAKRMGVWLTTDQLAYQQKLHEATTLSSKEGGGSSAADKFIAYSFVGAIGGMGNKIPMQHHQGSMLCPQHMDQDCLGLE